MRVTVAVLAWADEVATCIPEKGFDGVLLDQEAIDMDFNQTEKDAVSERPRFCLFPAHLFVHPAGPGRAQVWLCVF